MQLDRIQITDLLVSGIIGINPDERVNKQDVRINFVGGHPRRGYV